MILLIDGDCLVYKFAHAHQERYEVEYGEEGLTFVTWHALLEPAVEAMMAYIEQLKEETHCGRHEVYFSDLGRNFRYNVGLSYKENRGMSERPLIFYHLRSHLIDLGAKVWDNLEGDDCLGIRATEEPEGTTCIATIDKDLKQIPGLYYSFFKEDSEVEIITREAADRFLLFQVLAGDRTDGYGGCPGLGEVNVNRLLDREPKDKAKKILDSFGADETPTDWEVIVRAYELAGLTEDQAVMTYNLARILRAGDYNKATGEVQLWSPK